jgi:starvation-inducible outer membrane lipoprotein
MHKILTGLIAAFLLLLAGCATAPTKLPDGSIVLPPPPPIRY